LGPIPPGTIGQANLDGTGVNQGFITDPTTPLGLAVDSSHIYWANVFDGTIGRANLDGTGVDQSFITGAIAPQTVAVDAGHIYWTDQGTCPNVCPDPQPNEPEIGRANLDGTGVNVHFIPVTNHPYGVAVDANHLYWINAAPCTSTCPPTTIARANLDGTEVDLNFISGGRRIRPLSLAVDANHLYWGNGCSPCHLQHPSSAIARANLDGTGVDLRFIRGVDDPTGVAVDANHVYWSDLHILIAGTDPTGTGTIGRANLDGTGADQNFITGATIPEGVAVDAG
jgi:hypothetical protein